VLRRQRTVRLMTEIVTTPSVAATFTNQLFSTSVSSNSFARFDIKRSRCVCRGCRGSHVVVAASCRLAWGTSGYRSSMPSNCCAPTLIARSVVDAPLRATLHSPVTQSPSGCQNKEPTPCGSSTARTPFSNDDAQGPLRREAPRTTTRSAARCAVTTVDGHVRRHRQVARH